MSGNSTLKIAASISLGLHLLFLGIASNLFQTPKILRVPTRYVKVTLLPLVPKEKTKEKNDAKIILPTPLKVGNQDRGETGPDSKELNHEPLPYKSEARNVSLAAQEPLRELNPLEVQKPVEAQKILEELNPLEAQKPIEAQKPLEELNPLEAQKPVEAQKPLGELNPLEVQKPVEAQKPLEEKMLFDRRRPLSDLKEEEISNEQMNIAIAPGSVSDTNAILKSERNTGSTKEAILNRENLSVSLPSLHHGGSSGEAYSYASSGEASGLRTGTGIGIGTGSGNGSFSKGGSGKGERILGKSLPSLGGGKGVRPRYAENPKPIYPQEAREKGYEGEVVLRVEVLSDGRVGQIKIRKSCGYELLDRSALNAVRKWRFIPAQKGDVAIPLWVNIPIKFQLQ